MIAYLGCMAARGMLDAFVDDELPVDEQVVLEAHLRWCDTCRARVEDMRLIGSALRLRSGALCLTPRDAAALAAMQDEAIMRLDVERGQSLAARWREWVADTRYLWPALGATAALILCVWGATTVNQIVRAVRPDSMAALISVLANPGSDQNPLYLDALMLPPRRLDLGRPLPTIPEGEAVFALAAVVTREGRVANYEVLRTVGEPEISPRLADVVRTARFEPAQTPDGAVAVNMVWLFARTTVKASLKDDPLSDAPARPPVLRPARS